MKKFRVFFTCKAEHTSYQDFSRKIDARKFYERTQDRNDWYATHILPVKITLIKPRLKSKIVVNS